MPDSGGNGSSVNVLVAEDSLQAIANAIRAKNGSQNTYTPGEMATAIRAISGGGGSAVLGTKKITVNGTFDASDDGLDGFSSVTTDVHVGILEPYFENLTTGFVDLRGAWSPGGTDCFSDVYEVEADTLYLISLGGTVGTRFRATIIAQDPLTVTKSTLGTSVVSISDPQPYDYTIYTPTESGYLVIQKDNAGVSNLKTYVFPMHDLMDGNSLIHGGGGEAVLQLLTATANGTYTPATGYDGFSQVMVNVPEPTLIQKSVTENGVYDPGDDNADGFSEVTVAVPVPTLIQKRVSQNGVYDPGDDNADGFSEVTVAVPAPTLIQKRVTQNGVYDAGDDSADGYSEVTVAVPAPTLIQKSITQNGVYDAADDSADGFSEVTVAVPAPTLIQKNVTQNGVYDATSDNADGYSEVTVAVPAPTLIQKNITANGVYDPTDDNADGYSELNVDVRPGLMAPIFTDLDTGYVYGNTWTLGGSTVNYSDVYAVEAGKRYLIGLDDTVGTRFRVLVSEQSTIEATETLPGTLINNVSNPAPFASFLFTSSIDGYLTITKDNNGMANIKTYVYDYEALLNGTNSDCPPGSSDVLPAS